jgi:hypothetical protein
VISLFPPGEIFSPNCLIETQEGKNEKDFIAINCIVHWPIPQRADCQLPIKIKAPKTNSDPASNQPRQASSDNDRSGSRSDAPTTKAEAKPGGAFPVSERQALSKAAGLREERWALFRKYPSS